MKKLPLLGIIGGAALLAATLSADAQVYGYGYPAYSYGGYYGPALGAGYLGYRIARRVAIHRARWR